MQYTLLYCSSILPSCLWAVLSLTPTLPVNFRFLKILGLGFHVDKAFGSNTSMCVYVYIYTCVFLLKLLHMGKLTMPPRKTIPWCSFESYSSIWTDRRSTLCLQSVSLIETLPASNSKAQRSQENPECRSHPVPQSTKALGRASKIFRSQTRRCWRQVPNLKLTQK